MELMKYLPVTVIQSKDSNFCHLNIVTWPHMDVWLCGEMWYMADQPNLSSISHKKIRIFGKHLAVSVTKRFFIANFQI